MSSLADHKRRGLLFTIKFPPQQIVLAAARYLQMSQEAASQRRRLSFKRVEHHAPFRDAPEALAKGEPIDIPANDNELQRLPVSHFHALKGRFNLVCRFKPLIT